jgi:hypothetical protein
LVVSVCIDCSRSVRVRHQAGVVLRERFCLKPVVGDFFVECAYLAVSDRVE